MALNRFSSILLAVCLASPLAFAQTPSYRIRTRSVSELQADQRRLVSQWCRLDWEGTRLNADGWKKFDPLTTMKTNPDYMSVYVVSRYEIQPPDRVSMESTVTYNVLGRFEPGIGYTAEPDSRTVTFKFSDKEGDLQIVSVDPEQPNVSKPIFITWLKTQLAAAKTDIDKLPLQSALNQLEPPPQKPKTEAASSSSKDTKQP